MTKPPDPLRQISPDAIRKNSDNPRLIFREDEMTELMNSIREVGIKVPLSVYADGNRFVLLDGERRWRCAKRLNLPSVPAHVQPKPTRLENLLMMFNIHNVRVDWDPMPMAFKLAEVRDMLQREGKPNSAKDLAAITGVRLASVRRAFELLELPKHYQKLILKEAEKPREQQRITPDLFIEIFKSFRAVEKHTPEALEQFSKSQYTDALVKKYQTGVIDSVVAFREISKIARAELAGVSKEEATPTIVKLVKEKGYSIKQAFRETVESAYEQRDLVTKLTGLCEKLAKYKSSKQLKDDVLTALTELRAEIDRLLNS
ncbi:MAG TPA: ParB/RepB/Spo0J family partition protein [Verrucomicrobiae bacterium]|nr:ParB/RepB/Spo0J family partition protein [Verrucomicrobiae bacterium]